MVSPGEYAVRGGLIDLFPMGSLVPFRVDLFDDEIDSIRPFDPDSQRSLYPVPEVRLLPGREFPMDDDARARFRSRWRELLEGDPTKSRIYKDMGAGVATAGIEYYLPLFFEETATIFDYVGGATAGLPQGGAFPSGDGGRKADAQGHASTTVVLHGDLEPAFQRFWQDTKDRYRLVQGDPERPALPPESLFLGTEQFYARANAYAQLAIKSTAQPIDSTGATAKIGNETPVSPYTELDTLPPMAAERGTEDPLARLKAHARNTQHRILVLAESDGRRESLLDFLRASGE